MLSPTRFLASIGLLGVLASNVLAAPSPVSRAELVMGTIGRVTIDGGADDAAFEAVFAAFEHVDATMSLYRPASDLVRVNVHADEHAEPVDPELFACLAAARALSDLTDGAFDPTVLPLLRAWGAYPELGYLPRGRIDAVGWGGLLLDPEAHSVGFRRPGMGVDLGGVAKGFALDRARDALVAAGARDAILDLGGNLALVGAGPPTGWRIGIRDPRDQEATLATLVLDGPVAVSTSGNYARDFATEGWRTPSHVYDPRTGRPVAGDLAVTVFAPDATTADALSTALLVLGVDGGVPVLARMPEVGALFVDDSGGRRRLTLAGRAPRAFASRDAAAVMLASSSQRTGLGW